MKGASKGDSSEKDKDQAKEIRSERKEIVAIFKSDTQGAGKIHLGSCVCEYREFPNQLNCGTRPAERQEQPGARLNIPAPRE